MKNVLQGLGLDTVFSYFEQLCDIPHGSKNEKAISDYMVAFAKERGLYCRQDEAYNVLVKKPATKGYEHAKPIILQGHIDMVCEKEEHITHDFLKDPLELVVDGDFIRANGTTLGADNGIAAAYILAILDADDTLVHPPIEAIFTTEEEIGMGGANAFDPFDLEGRAFINLDTEEEGYLLVSCSGGRRVQISLPVVWEGAPKSEQAYRILITGLRGGHSGQEIHLQRANASVLMGRVLHQLQKDVEFSLASIDGGRLDNVICRQTEAIITCSEAKVEEVRACIKEMESLLQEEYNSVDPSITIRIEEFSEPVTNVLATKEKNNLIRLLLLLPYGVQTMSMDMAGLVESSTNIGVIRTTQTHVEIENAVRSSVASRKEWICQRMKEIAVLCGATVKENSDYPGWKFNPDSTLLTTLKEVYVGLTGKEAEVSAVHAGLECGLFGEKIEGLDMISIGPDMFDVHTPEEHLSISSTIRTWDFVLAILKKMAE